MNMLGCWSVFWTPMILLLSGNIFSFAISAVRGKQVFDDRAIARHYSPIRSELVFHPEWRLARQRRSLNVIESNMIHHEDISSNGENQHTDKEISHHSEGNSQLGTIAHKIKNVTLEEILLILKVHNKFRKRVKPQAANMRRMRWNDELARVAASYVSKCIYAHSDSSNVENEVFGAKLGENIFVVEGNLDLTSAINQWYNEVNNYDWITGNCEGVCGHYTQVVWDDSDEVGCSYAHCLGGTQVNGEFWQNVRLLVCNYFPTGNEKAGFWFNKKIRKPYTVGHPCTRCQSPSDTCYQGLCDGGLTQLITTDETSAVTTTTTTENVIETADNRVRVFKSEKREFGEFSWRRGAVVSIRIPTTIPEVQLPTANYDLTDDDKVTIVRVHNRIRSEVDPPASNLLKLSWSERLASQATAFIKKCSAFEENRQGDNLHLSEDELSVEDIIQEWSDERYSYGWEENQCYDTCNHYKQLVWDVTQKVGCARTRCHGSIKYEGVYWHDPYVFLCRYNPVGNNPHEDKPRLFGSAIRRPYIEGKQCSKCDAIEGICINGLCETSPAEQNPVQQTPLTTHGILSTLSVTILPCLCENGGMCVPDLRHAPGLGAYECRCMRGYTGKFCNETGAECLPGFTGVNCLEDIDECASEPCFPGIACNNVIGSFFCDMCPEGTVGDGMFCTDDYGDYLPEEEEGPATNMNQLPPSDKETTAVAKTTDTQTTTDIDETIQEDDFHTEQSLLIPSIVKITSEPERALATTISLQQANATTEVTTKSQTTFPTTQKRNDLITSTVVTSKKVKTTSSIQDATTVKYTTSPTTVERTTTHDATTTADRSTPKSTSVKSTTPEAEELTTSDDATTPPKARTTVLTTLETTASLETTTPLQTTATDRITTKHETTTMAEKSTSTTAQTTPSSTVLHRSSRPSTSAVKFTESGLGRLTTTAPEHTTTAEASATPKRAPSTTGKVSSTTTSTTTTTSKPPIRLTTKKPWRPYRPRMKVRRCKKTNGKKICKLVKKIPGSHRIKQRPNFATIGGKPMKYYVKQRDGKRVRYTYRGTDCIKQCGSRGKCMANGMCRCKPEYAGRFCERSACNDLCKNDGVCVSRNKCKCTDGYSGNLCEDFTCRLSCQNNGKCVGPDHCECPKGFEGETCEVPVCEPECENGGQCKENNLCSCQSGYMGHRCQQAVCRPGCLNGGTCTRKDVCACPPSFLGNRCQISVCIPTCGHGGRCLKNNVCMCRKGWKGTHCRTPICIDKCAHGGKCIAPNKCKCKNGWSGSSCRTGHCERRCRHGARCVRPNLCKCPYGPRGKGCRLKLRFGRKPSSVFGRL